LDRGRWQAGPRARVCQGCERRRQHRGQERSLQGLSILCEAALRDAGRTLRDASLLRRPSLRASGSLVVFKKTISVHPEEVPSFGTVSKGVAPVYRHPLHGRDLWKRVRRVNQRTLHRPLARSENP
jgi:hypothetical protein